MLESPSNRQYRVWVIGNQHSMLKLPALAGQAQTCLFGSEVHFCGFMVGAPLPDEDFRQCARALAPARALEHVAGIRAR